MDDPTEKSCNELMTPGSVFVMVSISPDTLFSLDKSPAKPHRFGPFEPIPLDVVPIRDEEHLDRLVRWDIYLHGENDSGKIYRLNIKNATRHKITWQLDSVVVVDARRIAFTLGLVKVLDLAIMHVDPADFDLMIFHIGIFSETTDTRHWSFGILQHFITQMRRHTPRYVHANITCPSMNDVHKTALQLAWEELPGAVNGYAPCQVFDLTSRIILTEEDEAIIYCNR